VVYFLYSAGLINVFVVCLIQSSVFNAHKRVLCITRPVLVVVVKPGRRISIADGICLLRCDRLRMNWNTVKLFRGLSYECVA